MKELSVEHASDVEVAFAGKLFAYVGVVDGRAGAALGVAVANEAGYSPIPAFFAHGSWQEMQDEADRLNAARGLSSDEAINIVCSSMAAGKVAS